MKRILLWLARAILARYEPPAPSDVMGTFTVPEDIRKLIPPALTRVRRLELQYPRAAGVEGNVKRNMAFEEMTRLHPHYSQWACSMAIELAYWHFKEHEWPLKRS